MKSARAAVSLLAAVLTVPELLAAQVCDGLPSHRTRPLQAAAGAAAYSYATEAGVAVSGGVRAAYARASLGAVRDGEVQAGAPWARADFGMEVTFNGIGYICPVASYGAVFGPNNFMMRDRDQRRRDIGLGIGFAAALARSRPVAITPFVRVAWHRLTFKNIPSPEAQANNVPVLTYRDSYVELGAGAGLTWRGVTLRPGITMPLGFPRIGAGNAEAVPFGREDGEVSLNLAVAVALRRATRPAP